MLHVMYFDTYSEIISVKSDTYSESDSGEYLKLSLLDDKTPINSVFD